MPTKFNRFRLSPMKVTLIDYTQNAVDKLIYTKATRLTQGEETRVMLGTMTPEEKASELKAMARTIESSWEFVSYTFEILAVTRAFTHQLVRTRTGSYAQQTMRVLPMEKFTYEVGPTIGSDPKLKHAYEGAMANIQVDYDWLLNHGAAIEDARGILPTNIHTNIIAQFSLRTVAEMLKKRIGARTQGEYRTFLTLMVAEVLRVHPWAEVFLFPDYMRELQVVENLLEDFASHIPRERLVSAQKALDKIRKKLE